MALVNKIKVLNIKLLRSITYCSSLLICIFSCNHETRQAAEMKAMITISTDTQSKPYNPMIFGGFIVK